MTSAHVELRSADIANNPYLGGAMVLAAGLEGIREEIDPGDPHRENIYLKTPQELDELGIETLPRDLKEALDAFEADPLSEAVMGSAMYKAFLDFKRAD